MFYFFRELTLSFYQGGHLVVRHRLAEFHVHVLILLQQVHHFLNTFLDDFYHCLFRIHLRFLLQIAYGIAWSPYDFSLITFLHSGDDFHESGFAGTVQTYDTYLRSVKERQIDVLEDYFIVMGQYLPYPIH